MLAQFLEFLSVAATLYVLACYGWLLRREVDRSRKQVIWVVLAIWGLTMLAYFPDMFWRVTHPAMAPLRPFTTVLWTICSAGYYLIFYARLRLYPPRN